MHCTAALHCCTARLHLQVTTEHLHGPCDILSGAVTRSGGYGDLVLLRNLAASPPPRYIKRVFPPAAANVFSHVDPQFRKLMKRAARKELRTDPM